MNHERTAVFLVRKAGEIAQATVFPLDLASSRRRFVLIYAIRLVFLVARRLWADRCQRQAAAMAFQTLLSIVPLAMVFFSVASLLDIQPWRQRAMVALSTLLLPEAAADAARVVENVLSGARGGAVGLVGGLSLGFLAFVLLFHIESTINEVFRRHGGRSLLERLLISVTILGLAPTAIGLSLWLTPAAMAWVWGPLSAAVGLFLCYWLLPRGPVRVRYALVAAGVAAGLFEAVKQGFALYVAEFGTTLGNVYGTLAILPLFLVWLYTAWLIFLFGAELAAALHEVGHHGHLDRRRPAKQN